jgi:putative PEP-CTERM system TPR-repeat lipoprotein
VLRVLGAAQLGTGQKEQALATYGKLAAMQPNSPRDLLRLATAQAANADPASATGTLRKALALQPQFPEAQMALLRLDVGAGHYDDALKLAHEAQQQTPKFALGYVMEGDVLMARRAYGEAAHAYETAYGLNKRGDIAARVHQASVAAGKAHEADALLAQRIKESPEDFALRTYAADHALRTGRFEEAMQNYEWLARKQPDNAVFLNNLAWIYLQLKDGRAVETAERAHTLEPDDAGISDTLAWVLVQRGDLARATALLRDAATRAPGIPSIRYHLAYAWYKAGETSKARAELEALLAHADSFPERQEASSLLKQLKG